jgi:uncharacterized membrane protein
MNTYLLLKLVHVIAVIIFIGNITLGLFWMRQANKTGNFSIISFTMKGIISSDKWFTIPGVVIITAAGISAAMRAGLPLLRTGWIFWSLVLFSISGIIFSVRLAPLQRKILHMTENNSTKEINDDAYKSHLRQWETWGLLALVTPVAAMVMMVLKIPAHSGF